MWIVDIVSMSVCWKQVTSETGNSDTDSDYLIIPAAIDIFMHIYGVCEEFSQQHLSFLCS